MGKRAAANGVATGANWLANFAVGQLFLLVAGALGPLAFIPFGAILAAGFLFSSPRPVPRFGTRHALMAWSTTSPAHARFSADNAAFASASVETGNARWATKTLPRSVTGRERKKRTVLPAKRPPSASEPREWTWHSASAMSPAEVKDSGRRVRDDSETRGEVCWHVPAISRVFRLV